MNCLLIYQNVEMIIEFIHDSMNVEKKLIEKTKKDIKSLLKLLSVTVNNTFKQKIITVNAKKIKY